MTQAIRQQAGKKASLSDEVDEKSEWDDTHQKHFPI
jgi:hypothetical protein